MIGSALGRIAMADKMSVDQLKEALQNKTLPAYIALPLIEEKMNMRNRMMQGQAAMAQQQPPIADQIMQRTQAAGIDQIPSNLPPANMAGGGIVAFDDGGDVEDDEDTDTEDDKMDKDTESMLRQLMASYKSRVPPSAMGIEALGSGLRMPSTATEDKGIPQITLSSAKEERSTGLRMPSGHKYEKSIVSQAEKLGLDPEFAMKLAMRETGGLKNPEAAKSRAGALGIMQLMPGTARDMGVDNPLDPEQNIAGGLRYAKMMLDKYQDPKLAAIAYNWGPGNTDKWLKSGADMSKLPKETQNYVANLKEGGAIRFQNQGLAIDPDLEKEMNELGAQLDAARLAVGKPPSSRELYQDPTLAEKYKANVERRNQLQKQYETLMETKGGLGGPMQMQPSSTGRKMVPVANPIVQQMVKSAPPTAAQAATMPLAQAATPEARAFQSQYEAQDIQEGDLGRLATPASSALAATQVPTQEQAAAPSFADKLEALLNKREQGITAQREQDKYMALLAAGLGMMGGTSRHAMQNIGQGALQGVAYAQGAAKQRAAEENALLSGRLGQYKVGQYESIRKDLAAQGQETKITQQLGIARQNMIKNVAAAKKIDLGSISDPNILATIESQADAMLARDPAYQTLYKRLYGTDFSPAQMARGPVDYVKNYSVTPRKQ